MKYLIILITAFSMAMANAEAEKQKPITMAGIQFSDGKIGLSFLPPDEAGWNVIKHTPVSIDLTKKGLSDDENWQIESYVTNLDGPVEPISEFIGTIKKNVAEGYNNNPNFKISQFEVIADPNKPRCARLHLKLEYINPKRTVNNEYTKYSEQYALSCGFEKAQSLGIEMRYYYRYYQPNADARFAEKANKLFSSVTFPDQR